MQEKPFCFEEYQSRSDHESPGEDQPPLARLLRNSFRTRAEYFG